MIETAQAFGVDIGGSGIKAAPVNLEKGEFAEPRLKILTPEVSTPEAVAAIVRQQPHTYNDVLRVFEEAFRA